MSSEKSFTGRVGRHKAKWSVRMMDRVSSVVITIGGIGTIVAVSFVFFVLMWVVWRLFSSASAGDYQATKLAAQEKRSLYMAFDEYLVLAWNMDEDGVVQAFRIDSGEVVWEKDVIDGYLVVSASSDRPDGGRIFRRC